LMVCKEFCNLFMFAIILANKCTLGMFGTAPTNFDYLWELIHWEKWLWLQVILFDFVV
jgi:hypothetical protein